MGAIITGAIAIWVNYYSEKQRKKEDAQKTKKINSILRFYLEEIKENYKNILSIYDKYNSYPDNPWDNELFLVTVLDEEGNEETYPDPPSPVIEEYEKFEKPLRKRHFHISKDTLNKLEQIVAIDLFSLEAVDVDAFLEIVKEIKKTHIPYFKEVSSNYSMWKMLDEKEMEKLIFKIDKFAQ